MAQEQEGRVKLMVQWAARRAQSLRFKLVVGLAVVLTVTLGLFFYLQYTRHQDRLLSQMITATTLQSELIESSLRHSMITRDPDELASIFEHVSGQEGLLNIMLLDKAGRIAASAEPQEIGTQLDITSPSCQLCHRGPTAEEGAKTVVFTTESGTEVFRNVNLVENGPECQFCHPSESAINGVLVADFSMADIERQTAVEQREMLDILVAAVVVVVLATSLVTRQLVLARLKIVVDAVRRAGAGDLDQALGFRGHDEIDELAHAFDRMAAGLKDKARLEVEAAETARLAAERESRLRILSTFSLELEGRVVRRTEELARARDELEEKARQLQQLLAGLIHIQEEERGRIARDMHDGLIQLIIGALYEIQAAKENLPARPDVAVEKLRTAQALLTQIEAETRRVIYDLRPMILDSMGLAPALKKHAQTFTQLFGISCSVQVTGTPFRLAADKEVAIYRIVQEALHNVQAHSGAAAARVHLAFRPAALHVVVEDDGQGFDDEEVARAPRGRLGFIGMRERAQGIGAEINVGSVVGQGTVVRLRVPRE